MEDGQEVTLELPGNEDAFGYIWNPSSLRKRHSILGVFLFLWGRGQPHFRVDKGSGDILQGSVLFSREKSKGWASPSKQCRP
jgi:hypothetical protein